MIVFPYIEEFKIGGGGGTHYIIIQCTMVVLSAVYNMCFYATTVKPV